MTDMYSYRVCPVCGRQFEPESVAQAYDKTACREKAAWQRKQQRKEQQRADKETIQTTA
jgi:DNA repair exonuclease SbcCD ATPase subunit